MLVAVHNVPRLIRPLFCQPYTHSCCAHAASLRHILQPCALPSSLRVNCTFHIHPQLPNTTILITCTAKHVGYTSIIHSSNQNNIYYTIHHCVCMGIMYVRILTNYYFNYLQLKYKYNPHTLSQVAGSDEINTAVFWTRLCCAPSDPF